MPGRTIKGAFGAAFTFALIAAPAQAEITDPHVPGEVIVQFAPGAGGTEREAARDQAETEALEGLGSPGLQLVEVADGGSVAQTIRELEADPAVRFAEPNGIDRLSAVPNDPSFPSLWGLLNAGQTVNGTAGTPDADIDAPEAWDIEAGNPGTVVAIMDSGADLSHPDLAPQLWQNPDETPASTTTATGSSTTSTDTTSSTRTRCPARRRPTGRTSRARRSPAATTASGSAASHSAGR